MKTITEPAREVPVACEVDVAVLGGSCTGVFAAVAAAREGASVALVERQGFFGGMATAALVSVWHSDMDTEFSRVIIGGLTREVIDRLSRRDAVITHKENPHSSFVLGTEELKCELDELVTGAGVTPFLHSRFAAPVLDEETPGSVAAAVIEDKSGRRAIRARVFVDATGDGDLIARVPYPFTKRDDLQPPTMCVRLSGVTDQGAMSKAISGAMSEGLLPHGFAWWTGVAGAAGGAGSPGELMLAGTRVPDCDCSDADSLTHAEIEGRRQVRALVDYMRAEAPGCEGVSVSALPASVGIRETRHCECLHTLTEEEVLSGLRFDDAVANGSYRVDVHHSDKPGLTFRYLDGREEYVVPGAETVRGRWREETGESPTFYQIPYRSLVPRGAQNVLVAGRLMGADRGAYGAVRVMVNCNQTGEAAGTAASMAAASGCGVADVDAAELRERMAAAGSVVI